MSKNTAFCFDTLIDRKGSNSLKWDSSSTEIHAQDILPMWVADMDFATPKEVIQEMQDTVRHGIFGYTSLPEDFYRTIVSWCDDRYEFKPKADWITLSPGIISGICMSLQAFTKPGDEVIIQPPVYPQFFSCTRDNSVKVVENPLIEASGGYVMDIDHLKSCINSRTRMIILCSPHNPVGRVWTREELEAVAEIACRHNLIVFSDEIHCDIVYNDHRHYTFASLSGEVSRKTITGISPGKTFNIAGLGLSATITENKQMKQEIDRIQQRSFGDSRPNIFSLRSMQAAYRHGTFWLDALLQYLESNARYACDYIEKNIPQIKTRRPEATYLLWMDFRSLGLNRTELQHLILNKAKVRLNEGSTFGKTGEGFMRLNFGCPRSTLEEGLNRLAKAINKENS